MHHVERDRQNEHRRRIIDAQRRHFFASRASTRRQLHEDQAANNQNFPTSAVRPRVGSRLRRRITGGFPSPHRTPSQFGPASFDFDLAEPTLPRIGTPDMALAEYSGEAEVNRRRKRPKLDAGLSTMRSKSFHYDWNGRARPGRLRMEIHDCDGGVHSDAAERDSQQYKLDNVLVNDQSVYCTERNRCNIVLRHRGEVGFNLTKIVIKAPEKGFTAP